MQSVIEFIRLKHNSLVQFVGALIAALGLFDVIDWTSAQIEGVLLVVTLFFVLFGAQTVTSNARLTDSIFGGFNGVRRSRIVRDELNDRATRRQLESLDKIDPVDFSNDPNEDRYRQGGAL